MPNVQNSDGDANGEEGEQCWKFVLGVCAVSEVSANGSDGVNSPAATVESSFNQAGYNNIVRRSAFFRHNRVSNAIRVLWDTGSVRDEVRNLDKSYDPRGMHHR